MRHHLEGWSARFRSSHYVDFCERRGRSTLREVRGGRGLMRHVDGCTLLIDLSNVCRDDRLIPVGKDADWHRLRALLDAIDRVEDIQYSGYYLVADRTLRGRLDVAGKRELRSAESDGYLEIQEFADERLVELAFGSSALTDPILVTNDWLDDFRRSYPELDSALAVAWEPEGNGRPRPTLRQFGTRTHYRVSRKEEEGELRRRRLLRQEVQEEAARWYYQCSSRTCAIAAFWPEQLEELPKFDTDTRQFVCPGCGSRLTRRGERQPAVQVIVYQGHREVARLLVETGIELGRADDPGCIGLARFVDGPSVAAVSRKHVRVHVDGERVEIEDLGSKNGTRIEPRLDGRAATQLAPGRRVDWKLRDAVVLPGGIRLERSGRRLPMTGERPLTSPSRNVAPTATRLVSREPT